MDSRNRNVVKRKGIILYILLLALYLTWRTVFTLNTTQIVASILFLVVDMATCFSAIMFVVSFWRPPINQEIKVIVNSQLSIVNCLLMCLYRLGMKIARCSKQPCNIVSIWTIRIKSFYWTTGIDLK